MSSQSVSVQIETADQYLLTAGDKTVTIPSAVALRLLSFGNDNKLTSTFSSEISKQLKRLTSNTKLLERIKECKDEKLKIWAAELLTLNPEGAVNKEAKLQQLRDFFREGELILDTYENVMYKVTHSIRIPANAEWDSIATVSIEQATGEEDQEFLEEALDFLYDSITGKRRVRYRKVTAAEIRKSFDAEINNNVSRQRQLRKAETKLRMRKSALLAQLSKSRKQNK